MSKYTTEVRYICETEAGLSESTGFNNIGQVLHSSHNNVIGDYPIFDEKYRETLNTKILRHYYTREICEETVGLWKLRLNTRMNEIMPYYNKLYSSELLNFNPFYDIDLTTNHLRNEDTKGNLISKTKDERNDSKNTGSEVERNSVVNNTREDETARNSNTETLGENNNASTNRNEKHSGVNSSAENQNTSTNKNETHSGVNASTENSDTKNQKDKYSDTPQGGITGLESGTYLTNARIIDATETGRQQTNQQTDALGSTEYNENGRQQTNQQTDELGSTEYSENGSSKDSTNSSSTEHFNTVGKSDNKDSTKTATSETLNSNANGERNDENNINTTEDYLEHVQGKRGGISFSKMLSEYRETFLNIDRMVIDELSDLFFGLWD